MTVSICIPTFNSSTYLPQCIESALGQTYPDFEIVVSDNASTDNTCEIVSRYNDSRIRLHRLESNRGMCFNFNTCASLAQGKYVKFLCSDDLIASTCLDRQVKMLERYPDLIMVTSGLLYIDATGKVLKQISWCRRETILRDVDVLAANLAYGNIIGAPSAVLIRRENLMKAGPFSESFPQAIDLEMWLRLASQGAVGYCPEPLCLFRLHPQAVTIRFQKMGLIRSDLRRITNVMLESVTPTFVASRVAWGRVAGSFLKQACAGFRAGYVKWPLDAIWQALRMDPAFTGLAAFGALFYTGLLGFYVDKNRVLRVRRGATLNDRT